MRETSAWLPPQASAANTPEVTQLIPPMTIATQQQERTFEDEAKKRYQNAANVTSLPGELCKLVGVAGAGIGGLLAVASIATGSVGGLFASGGVAIVGALAGAPVAALGSIATSTKRNNRLNELDLWMKINQY